MKSCFFIGHREISEEIFSILMKTVAWHIAHYGVTEFIVGNYGSFDRLAAKVVICAKERYREITLSMLLPYQPTARSVLLPRGFDTTFYPPGMETVPRKIAIVRANRYMIDHTDYLIAYAWHPASNARDLVEYAKRRAEKGKITVTNLSEVR